MQSCFAALKEENSMLKEKLSAASIHNQSINGELNRILAKLKDAELQKKRIQSIADQERTKNAIMLESFETSENKIRELTEQNDYKSSVLTQQNSRITTLLKLSEQYKGEIKDQKYRIEDLEREVAALKAEMSKEQQKVENADAKNE